VIAASAQILLAPHYHERVLLFRFEEIYDKPDRPPKHEVLQITREPLYVVIYNSLPYMRKGW